MNIIDRFDTGIRISELQRTSLLTENYNGDKVILLFPSRLGLGQAGGSDVGEQSNPDRQFGKRS